MNSTLNETYHGIDFWFDFYSRSSHTIDLLYFYFFMPLSLLTFVVNSITLYVLNKQEFISSPFFTYIRIYTLNSIVISFNLIPTFIQGTYRVFRFTNSYSAIFYGCYVYNMILSTLYLYGSFLEILIVIERSLYFLPSKFKIMKITNIRAFCLFLLLLSFIICLPVVLILYPAYSDVKLDQNTTYRIYYWGKTKFSETSFGNLLTYLMYFFRDILTLVVKIVLNVSCVIMVKNYLDRLKMEKLLFAQKISTMAIAIENGNNQASYISRTNRNQTYIAVIMCSFSLFEHVLYISSYLLYFTEETKNSKKSKCQSVKVF